MKRCCPFLSSLVSKKESGSFAKLPPFHLFVELYIQYYCFVDSVIRDVQSV